MYKYMPVVLLSLAVAVRLPSSVPHQAERSCPAGGRPSDTQLSAGWQPPPTSQLDKRWSFQMVKYGSQNSTKGELSDGFLKKILRVRSLRQEAPGDRCQDEHDCLP